MLNRRSFLALVVASDELQKHVERLRQLREPDDLRRRLLRQREDLLQLRAETIAHRHRLRAILSERLTIPRAAAVDPVDGVV